ncbi:MAG TPA: TolC family protein [Gammaproteobacteria bacterium]|nr:TolC family protein [Gammaproteobacteria bacterium]
MSSPACQEPRCAGRLLVTVFLVALAGHVLAEPPSAPPPAALPQPLTLEAALGLADAMHPDLLLAQAALDGALAEQQAIVARNGFNADLEARLRWIDPLPTAIDQSVADHRLALFLSKTLYDFGYSRASLASAEHQVRVRQYLLTAARQQRRIEIMQRYFDVLLADLRFLRDNEAMAMEYVTLDKLRNQQELGQISDLAVLEQEAAYQRMRQRWVTTQHRQRLTRNYLAVALNHPREVPGELVPPSLGPWPEELPEVETLQAEALENNLELRALRASLDAAREQLVAAGSVHGPVLRGEAAAFEQSREIGSRERWRAGVVLELPLLDGGESDAAVAQAQAEVFRLEAELARREQIIRLGVLDLWMKLDGLRIQREGVEAELDYRELYLDEARSLYEMEVRARLGDAMVRITDAQLAEMEAQLQTELAWAQLHVLLGRQPRAADGGVRQPLKERVR